MQIKSWQIAALGTICNLLVVDWFLLTTRYYANPSDYLFNVSAFYLFYGGIPTFLLFFNKTIKIGAIVSLLVVCLFIFSSLWEKNTSTMNTFIQGGILGVSLLMAGIHYFWKKV